MREIKFRAWDDVTNEMSYCGENVDILFMLGSAGIECTDIRNVSPDGHDVYKEHLKYMQYTGLKDKSGKGIYEGDILTANFYPYQDDGEYNYHGVIEWDNETASFYMWKSLANKNKRGISHGIGEQVDEIERFEVIGNIYENPELVTA